MCKTIVFLPRYISNPMLINGLKSDLRLYCVVTGFEPLRVYVLDDGLVRFATERYSKHKKNLKCRRMHLTNYSVNKKSDAFVRNTDAGENNTGSKWSLKALCRYLDDCGANSDEVIVSNDR